MSEITEAETQSHAEIDGTREEAARLGGQAVVAKYGREHMAELGRKGSRALVRKYGLKFYSEIAARNRGVKKRPKPVEEGA